MVNKLVKTICRAKIAILIPLFIILFLSLTLWLDIIQSRFYIIAKFTKTGPLFINMPVFYKGYKIGKTKEIQLGDDYKATLVKIVFYKENPKLSEDIVAKVKKLNENNDYIDLVTPDDASDTLIRKGCIVEGEEKFDIDSFLSDIADSGLIIPLIQTFSDTLGSINKASVEIQNFFVDSRSILNDNRQNVKQTTNNLALSTQSLNNLTSRLNNSITKNKVNNTTSNVDKSSANILSATQKIKEITDNINRATKNFDKTAAKVDYTVSQTNSIADSIKAISCGLKETLSKKFAGLRILFGKPIKEHTYAKCCPK